MCYHVAKIQSFICKMKIKQENKSITNPIIINYLRPRHQLRWNRLPSLRETGSTNLTAYAEFLTPRVVDPLSPTVADTKMIEVADRNHFGIGLIDL